MLLSKYSELLCFGLAITSLTVEGDRRMIKGLRCEKRLDQKNRKEPNVQPFKNENVAELISKCERGKCVLIGESNRSGGNTMAKFLQ